MKQVYPPAIEETISNDFLSSKVIWSCFKMAHDEMGLVVDRPDEKLKENREKLRFIYSHKDNWVPLDYYDDMKRDFPEIPILLENKDIEHGFVENEKHVKIIAQECEKLIFNSYDNCNLSKS